MQENHLIINFNKGKTEFVMYDTAQKLAKADTCSISINGNQINQPDEYEYLDTTLDKKLPLKSHINKVYKKASSRLKLLKRARYYISSLVAQTIYDSMIQPIPIYCSSIYGNLNKTGSNKLQQIQNRGCKIIGLNINNDNMETMRKHKCKSF